MKLVEIAELREKLRGWFAEIFENLERLHGGKGVELTEDETAKYLGWVRLENLLEELNIALNNALEFDGDWDAEVDRRTEIRKEQERLASRRYRENKRKV